MTAPTLAVPTDIAHYLDAAPSFVERVADAADWIDAERRMPPDLAADMADAGFFRLLLPRELGGAELAHPDFLRILELFAAADASVSWCLNQNNVFSTRSTRMPRATAQEIWHERRAVVTNGPPARRVEIGSGAGRLPAQRALELQQRQRPCHLDRRPGSRHPRQRRGSRWRGPRRPACT